MNKNGELEAPAIAVIILGLIILFGFIIYISNQITVNALQISINNGNITTASLQEGYASRMNSWQDSYVKGYYDVIINVGNKTIKSGEKSGAGNQIYYIKEYVKCVNVTVRDTNTQENLSKYTVCKNG